MRKLIFGTGQIETLSYFSTQLCKAADRIDVEYDVIDLDGDIQALQQKLLEYKGDTECAAIVFNMRCDVKIWEEYEIPVYDILVDHPRRFTEFLSNTISNLTLIVLDRAHVEYVREHFPKVKNVFFLPLGGTREGAEIPYTDRSIDVLYAGSNSFSPYFPRLTFLQDVGEEFYSLALDMIIEQPDLSGEDVLKLIGVSGQIDYSAPEWKGQIWKIADVLEQNARAVYKKEMMKKLSESGIPVDIYGNNWEIPGYFYHENIHIHESVASKEINQITGNAKISLNSMPWFKNGAHDRIFTAMLNGAVSVTDPSKYLIERFENAKDIVFYDLTNMDVMVENIRFLLEHPKMAAEIADNGRKKAEQNDTWDCRIQDLLEIINNN